MCRAKTCIWVVNTSTSAYDQMHKFLKNTYDSKRNNFTLLFYLCQKLPSKRFYHACYCTRNLKKSLFQNQRNAGEGRCPKNRLRRVRVRGFSRLPLRWCGGVAFRLIQLKVRGGMANFMQLSVKTCRPFLFLRRTHHQVFNFYNEPLRRLWRRRRVSGRRGDFLCHKLDTLARGESAILTNLSRKLVPGVWFLKDQRVRRDRPATLSKVQHRCQQASWNF